MVKPERRTRGDIIAAAAIAAVIAVASALIWWTSDARATISKPAATPLASPPDASVAPASLRELWSASSPKTTEPMVTGGSVVSAKGGEVQGHDPLTGAVAWSYARDLELCGVTRVYRYAVAVYPDDRGCGQVSTIDGQTGQRGPTRSAYADRKVTLSMSTDHTTVLAAGDNRLEMWRSDMVRMLSWGKLDARIKPDVPSGHLCRLVSAAASTYQVSVLEACPDNPDMRLTLLKPAKEEDTPGQKIVPLPGVPADSGARVIAVSDTNTAVYVPFPRPTVNIIDETGVTVFGMVLPKPPSGNAPALRTGKLITWWTGDTVLVFATNSLRYQYSIGPSGPGAEPGTYDGPVPIGPGVVMGDSLLVPVTDGVGVYNQSTGELQRVIPVSRPPGTTAVVPAVEGSTLLEQRGDTLVALG
jgi:hypothetical protein